MVRVNKVKRTSKRRSRRRSSKKRSVSRRRRSSKKRVSRRRSSKTRVSRRRSSKKRISRRRSRTRSKQRGGGKGDEDDREAEAAAAAKTAARRNQFDPSRGKASGAASKDQRRKKKEKTAAKMAARAKLAILEDRWARVIGRLIAQESGEGPQEPFGLDTQELMDEASLAAQEEYQRMGLDSTVLVKANAFFELDPTTRHELKGILLDFIKIARRDQSSVTFLGKLVDNVLTAAAPVACAGKRARAVVVSCGYILLKVASAIFRTGLLLRDNLDHIVAIGSSVFAHHYPKIASMITILALMVKVHNSHKPINDLKMKLKAIVRNITQTPGRSEAMLRKIFRGLTARAKVRIIEALDGKASYRDTADQGLTIDGDTWEKIKSKLEESGATNWTMICRMMQGDSGEPTWTSDELMKRMLDMPELSAGGDGVFDQILGNNERLYNIITISQGGADLLPEDAINAEVESAVVHHAVRGGGGGGDGAASGTP